MQYAAFGIYLALQFGLIGWILWHAITDAEMVNLRREPGYIIAYTLALFGSIGLAGSALLGATH